MIRKQMSEKKGKNSKTGFWRINHIRRIDRTQKWVREIWSKWKKEVYIWDCPNFEILRATFEEFPKSCLKGFNNNEFAKLRKLVNLAKSYAIVECLNRKNTDLGSTRGWWQRLWRMLRPVWMGLLVQWGCFPSAVRTLNGTVRIWLKLHACRR